jgi:Tfp pilus assembly protein PilF
MGVMMSRLDPPPAAHTIGLGQTDARATQDLALRVMRSEGAAEAEAHARDAVRAAPLDPQSHLVMAMVLTEGLKPHDADWHYRRAAALRGTRDPVMLANHALCLRMQGRFAEGRALYGESHAGAPHEAQILLDWAKLEEAGAHFAEATELLDRAARLAPSHPGLRLSRAVLQARQGDPLAALGTLADDGAIPLEPEEMLQRGRLLDQLGLIDDAFAAFDKSRATARAAGKPQYDAAKATDLAARLREFFTAARLRTLPRAAPRTDRPQPLFILGFPRSGTTLVEQTLTATSSVAAGGELPLLWEVTSVMPRLLGSPLKYPEALSELWMADRSEGLEVLRDHYLHRLPQFGVPRSAALVTDKMPLNEMHLGLIALLFPGAPLIHVIRHPLDVALSVYSNNLSHGFHCATSLESVARHYALVAELVEHYRAQIDQRHIAVRYEDIVRNQEREVRRLAEFAGIPFAAAQLRFHENARATTTASYAQVKEPLYDRSVERWRRYRTHLAPAIPILRPIIERLGYDCD